MRIERRIISREPVAAREARRANAEAIAKREHPGADGYEVSFYNGDTLVAIWRGKTARMYRVVGEVAA